MEQHVSCCILQPIMFQKLPSNNMLPQGKSLNWKQLSSLFSESMEDAPGIQENISFFCVFFISTLHCWLKMTRIMACKMALSEWCKSKTWNSSDFQSPDQKHTWIQDVDYCSFQVPPCCLNFLQQLLTVYDAWSLTVLRRPQDLFGSIITSPPPGPHAKLRACCKTSFSACSSAMHHCFFQFQSSGCMERLEFSYDWDYFSQRHRFIFQLFYPFSIFTCALHLLKKKTLVIYLRCISMVLVFLLVQWISMHGRVISLFFTGMVRMLHSFLNGYGTSVYVVPYLQTFSLSSSGTNFEKHVSCLWILFQHLLVSFYVNFKI